MIDINSTLLIQLANFIVLLIALNFILYGPLRKIMLEREEEIGGAFTDAKNAQERTQSLLEQYNAFAGRGEAAIDNHVQRPVPAGPRRPARSDLCQKQFEEKLASADQLLKQPDAESLRKAAAELIDLCAERDGNISEAAGKRLTTLAKRDATLLLDGLNHPRLAARIHVANLLRSQFGDAFDVDPWSEAAARQQGIARWRERLSKPQPTAGRNP